MFNWSRITGALLIASASACYSYQPMRPHPLTPQEAAHPVHVQRINGTQVTLRAAHVSGDTLYGRTGNGAGEVAIPFREIYTVAAREKDSAKTTALAASVALVAALTVAIAGSAN